VAEDGRSRLVDVWPIFPDDTDCISLTRRSGATICREWFWIRCGRAKGSLRGNLDHAYEQQQRSNVTHLPWWWRQRWSPKRWVFSRKWYGLLPYKNSSRSRKFFDNCYVFWTSNLRLGVKSDKTVSIRHHFWDRANNRWVSYDEEYENMYMYENILSSLL
jgi:hypothetical protein